MKNRTNEEWMRDLEATGAVQSAALDDLSGYLLRAALYILHRKQGELSHLGSEEIEQLAQDAAQDALLAILKHLREFRSDSKFTTWAYKFAVNFALVTARRECWRHVSLDQLLEQEIPVELPSRRETIAIDPDRAARQAEAWETVRGIMENSLTERQRKVIQSIVLEDVPLDELARHWGSNRNAIYKLLHDARRKLKAELEAQGLRVGEVLDLFAGQT